METKINNSKKISASTGKELTVFSRIIKDEFLKRRKKNSSYSLRSFARQLGIDASLLSKILSGKRSPSTELISAVGPKLGLETQQVMKLIKGEMATGYQKMDDDIFYIISDWYHFAILELMKTKSFQSDSVWIAKRLNTHKVEVEAALERLEKLDFIEKANGKYTLLSPNNSWANTEITNIARKNLQRQLTAKASEALEMPFTVRESGSLTVACSQSLLPEIKNRIQTFRREIDDFIESQGKQDDVFQLVVSFYPLTNLNK